MDLSSKCAGDLKKGGVDLCRKMEWSIICPHTCRGLARLFLYLTMGWHKI